LSIGSVSSLSIRNDIQCPTGREIPSDKVTGEGAQGFESMDMHYAHFGDKLRAAMSYLKTDRDGVFEMVGNTNRNSANLHHPSVVGRWGHGISRTVRGHLSVGMPT
jgi:hypothetical protein